jgi:hypothetical protein
MHFTRGLPILERKELPLSRVRDGFAALNGDYRLSSETVIKLAVRPDAD